MRLQGCIPPRSYSALSRSPSTSSVRRRAFPVVLPRHISPSLGSWCRVDEWSRTRRLRRDLAEIIMYGRPRLSAIGFSEDVVITRDSPAVELVHELASAKGNNIVVVSPTPAAAIICDDEGGLRKTRRHNNAIRTHGVGLTTGRHMSV